MYIYIYIESPLDAPAKREDGGCRRCHGQSPECRKPPDHQPTQRKVNQLPTSTYTHAHVLFHLPAWQKPPAHQPPQSVGIQPPTAMYASTHVCYSSTHPKRSNSTPYCYTYTHVCVMVLLLRGMRSARNSTPYFHIYTLPCTHCHVHTRVCDGAVAAHNAQC